MTPADLLAIAKILSMVGTWPIGVTVCAAVMGPWVVLFLVSRAQDTRLDAIRAGQATRFEAVAKMYEDNTGLVRDYEKFAGEMVSTVKSNTESITRLIEHLEHRTPCYKFVRGVQPAPHHPGNGDPQ